MYISTSTTPFDKMGNMRSILIALKKAGFDGYDYSMFYHGCENTSVLPYENWKERAEGIRKLAEEIGVACNQSHAPFPSWLKGDEEYNKKAFADIVKAIEITGILGGKVCVVHPCNDATAEENAEFYNRLLPIAKRCEVKIGIENMWNWKNGKAAKAACSHHDDFLEHLRLLDEEWFVANVDIGHAEMEGLDTSAEKMLTVLGERVQALHIHDNDLYHDFHSLPFSVRIDFGKVCKALKEIKYRGDVTLEILLPYAPVDSYPVIMGYMASSANYIREYLQDK